MTSATVTDISINKNLEPYITDDLLSSMRAAQSFLESSPQYHDIVDRLEFKLETSKDRTTGTVELKVRKGDKGERPKVFFGKQASIRLSKVLLASSGNIFQPEREIRFPL
jgi:hypothetical protein